MTSAGLAALIVLVTSAVLTPSTRGEFAALQAGAVLLAAAGGLSLALGVSIVVGRDERAVPRAAALALLSSLLLAAVLTPIAAALADPLGLTTGTAVSATLVGAAIAGYGALQGIPIGLNRMGAYAVADITRATVSVVAIGIALIAGVREPAALLAIWSAGPIAGAVPLLTLARRHPQTAPWRATAGDALRRSLRAHPTNLVGLAVARLDIVVLAAVSTRPQVAYYSLAIVIAEAAWLLPSAFAITSLADYVRLPAREAWQAARDAMPRTLLAAGASGVLAGAGGVVAIVLLLPDAYGDAVAPLWIAIAGMIPYSAGHVVSPYLVTAVDRPGLATSIASVTLAVDMALLLALGGPLGALGAAIASTAAYAVHAALNLAALSREGRRATAR